MIATAKKERSIVFSEPLVKATIAGTKTQHRVRIDPQPIESERGGGRWLWGRGCRPCSWWINEEHVETRRRSDSALVSASDRIVPVREWLASHHKRPYRVGDRLWIRERCRAEELSNGTDGVRYLADEGWGEIEDTQAAADAWIDLYHYRQQRGANVPPNHMPRWASRITLEITEVRVERLDDISNADAWAEGCETVPCKRCDETGVEPTGPHKGEGCEDCSAQGWHTNRDVFRRLWESMNGSESWAANPWVWALSFKVV